MKRQILLFICVSLLITLSYGCSANTKETTQYDTPLYSITTEDGLYNLTPKVTFSDVEASRKFFYPEFQSIKEMRQGIITGSFTEEELYALSLTSSSADSGIEICDLDHLYECTAPEDLSLKHIKWHGKDYTFRFLGEKVCGNIFCYNEDQYTESFNKGYKDFLTNPLMTLISQEEIEERSATVYYCNTDVAKLKNICYEIRVGNKKMFIQEEYILEVDGDVLRESSEVPYNIYFWGEEQSSYFYGVFFYFTERPSVEWLCEFGLTPYVDSAAQ